ncbi:MAG TPA: VOC family protein [Xanthobacteraceae bacterium]|nr:VOC family protein [Xanthobacteraceae bacterium]
MIDHISIEVSDLARATKFYESVLGTLGMTKLRTWPTASGFGKVYPEFWLNARPEMPKTRDDSGIHICLRARGKDAVDAFFAAALREGATSDGRPGLRPEYNDRYYAAFIRDLDGNRIEAVTFLSEAE